MKTTKPSNNLSPCLRGRSRGGGSNSILFAFFVFSFFGFFVFSAAHAHAESIEIYEVELTVKNDDSLDVREIITYDFGDEQKHGIYRDIPDRYTVNGIFRYSTPISNIQVGDPFEIQREGSNTRIKIGDPDTLISGKKTYDIRYNIKRVYNYFNDYDELYWDAVGDNWNVPAENIFIKVILPGVHEKDTLKIACFQGPAGATTPCTQEDQVLYLRSENRTQVSFTQELNNPGESTTVAIGFPKGIIKQSSPLHWISDNWSLAVPIIVFVVMFFIYWTRGRDPKGRGTIIAEYEAPDQMTPLQLGILMDEKIDNHDISSELIYLATKGYLKINKNDFSAGGGPASGWELIKRSASVDLLSTEDKLILKELFASGDTIKISDLQLKFHAKLSEINKLAYDGLIERGYFPHSPATAKAMYFSIAGALAFIAFWLGFNGQIMATMLISAFIIFCFSFSMGVRTKKGVLAKESGLGLKEYIKVAEADRINFHNAPKKSPELFEKLLPYAIIFQLEKKWAKEFEGIYTNKPSWYNDSSISTFNVMYLTSSLGDFSKSSYSAMSSKPSSSGSGGGGFSGGGFGGGGGGSW